MRTPPTLRPGDTVAILSPASAVNPDFIDKAVQILTLRGYNTRVMPHAKGKCPGNYSGSIEERLSDLTEAWKDPDVKAILCARGGYGTVHLLPLLPEELIAENPKWLIGFSDISALHALMLKHKIISIHGPMAKDLDTPAGAHIFDILTSGQQPSYTIDTTRETAKGLPRNIEGTATGLLIGGNMAVIGALCGTTHDPYAHTLTADCILFLEDIAEPVYKVERMFYQLLLSGHLHRIKGLILGQFTEYSAHGQEYAMEQMISAFLIRHGLENLPVSFGFPVGHVDDNRPLLSGATVTLRTTPTTAHLRMSCF